MKVYLIKGTCAGLIVLADESKHMKEGGQPLIGGLKVLVDRNHFGSQLQVRYNCISILFLFSDVYVFCCDVLTTQLSSHISPFPRVLKQNWKY